MFTRTRAALRPTPHSISATPYHLAFRDLPALLQEHAHGRRALDFGCGTGRSTRFLQHLGYDTLGVDIAPEMLAIARQRQPELANLPRSIPEDSNVERKPAGY